MRRTVFGSFWALLSMVVLAGSAPASPLPPYNPDANAPRGSVPEIYRWDLSPLFADDAAFETALAAVEADLPRLDAYRNRLDDVHALGQALALYFELHDRANHCTLYANLKSNVDATDEHAASMDTRARALMDEVARRATMLRAALLAVDDATMEEAYVSEPALRDHRAYVENLRRRRARVLDAEAERVLGLMGDNLWAEIDLNELPSAHEETFGALLTDIQWPVITDENGQSVQMTLASYGRYRASADRRVRREAVQAMFDTLYRFRHAFAATLAGQYELDVALARARGYDRAIEAYLDKDDLDVAVYDNLIETIHDHLEPLHRFVSLRKKVMGLDSVHLYDLYIPLTEGDVGKEVDFETARETVLAALAPLGETYAKVLRTGLDPANGWIDLYPNAGKRSGAFSASVYGVHPYVMMNYQNGMDDMSTLAHEFGHAVHSHLAMTHQPYSSFRYVPFLAEIASTCNEALLTDHLLAQAKDRAERAALLFERAENIRTTIYRQTLFAEFEREVHRMVEDGTPVTAEALEQLYAGLIRTYYGPDYTVDEHDGMEWAYVPHFYYKYYVFTYATGLSSGLAIAQRVRELGRPAVDGLIAMLAGGASEPPLDLLKKAGVDLTTPEPIAQAARVFEETVAELEDALGEVH